MVPSSFKSSFNTKKIRKRILGATVFFLIGFLFIGARAFMLHLTDNAKLKNLASNQYRKKVVVAPKRGNILDTHGDTLAIDVQVDSLYVNPSSLADPAGFAKTLAPLLEMPEEKILERLRDKNKKFVWVKRRLTQEESQKIKAIKLEGLGTLPEYKRFYPNGMMAANLLGAVGLDAVALSGLEMTFDDTLKSEDPPLLVEQDAKGRSYAPYALTGLEHPKEIVLTLDKTIQYIAERELKSAVEKHHAIGGMAIVMDVHTGEILAMANQPTFDPNEYSKYELKNWRARSVTDAFEPGSIFKAFTAATALETGAIDMHGKLHCENGAMQVGKFTINDHHGYGLLTMPEIIKYSSNICSYKLAQKVGKKRFYEMMRAFGFGQKTGIEIPGEISGLMASLDNLGTLQLGTMAFGQGISTTPLQIVAAYSALANGGNYMKPFLVKEIRDSKGVILKTTEPQVLRRVISEKTAKEVTELLETVVEKGGTGTAAKLDHYRVAGKTGTAQKVIEGHIGYSKNKYFASFVGFAPARNPKIAVLVSIDEPKGEYYGGAVSAPAFKEIMGQSLAYLKVPNDDNAVTEVLPDKKGKKTEKDAGKKVKEKPVEKATAAKGHEENELPIATVGEALAIPENPETEGKIPNFTGLSVREALREAQSRNIRLEIKGSGICNQQEPPAGTELPSSGSIILQCQPPI